MTDKAVRFMRVNVSGTRVVDGNTTRGGRIRYRMEDGSVFVLDESDIATLDRYGFKPRFSDAKRTPFSAG